LRGPGSTEWSNAPGLFGSAGQHRLERCQALGANLMDGVAEILDASAEPGQLFLADPIMLGVARLHIGILELLEHGALAACLDRPDAMKAPVEPFRLGAQEADIVVVRRVEGAD